MILLMIQLGHDSMGEVPAERWVAVVPAGTPEVLVGRIRHGGFMVGAHLVDNAAFAVSPSEAAAMDPCQRLLLEHGYAALHGAEVGRAALSGSLTGIFLGFAAGEYAQVHGLWFRVCWGIEGMCVDCSWGATRYSSAADLT